MVRLRSGTPRAGGRKAVGGIGRSRRGEARGIRGARRDTAKASLAATSVFLRPRRPAPALRLAADGSGDRVARWKKGAGDGGVGKAGGRNPPRRAPAVRELVS